MKKNLLLACMLLCGLSIFTACSDDDENKTEPEVPVLLKGTTVFKGENLNLAYSGTAMPGKEVTFSTEDGKTGSLKMAGTLDLSALIPSKADQSLSLAPGVIPGEVSTLIENIVLTQEGDTYTFEGTDVNDVREISYSGKADSTSLKLDLTVKFATNDLLGTWNLMQLEGIDYKKEPIYCVWDADEKFEIMFGPLPLKLPAFQLVLMGVRMPLISAAADQKVSVEEMLCNILKDVTFKEDGNIVANYRNADNLTSEWIASPLNIAQYVVDGNGSLRLFLNPDIILANIKTKADIADLPEGVLEGIIGKIVPMLSQGIPLKYGIAEGGMKVYADTELMKTLFSVLMPILQDEKIMASLMQSIAQNPEMADFLPMIEGVFKSLPAVVESTTKIEIGLNFEK